MESGLSVVFVAYAHYAPDSWTKLRSLRALWIGQRCCGLSRDCIRLHHIPKELRDIIDSLNSHGVG